MEYCERKEWNPYDQIMPPGNMCQQHSQSHSRHCCKCLLAALLKSWVCSFINISMIIYHLLICIYKMLRLFKDTFADISAALFASAKCCVNAALVAPLATPAIHHDKKKSLEKNHSKKSSWKFVKIQNVNWLTKWPRYTAQAHYNYQWRRKQRA